MTRFDPAVEMMRAASRESVLAVWPFQNQTFRPTERSPSTSGKATDSANNICPKELTKNFDGEASASGGISVFCFSANVAESYSTAVPGAWSTHRRLFCAASNVERDSTQAMSPRFRMKES